MADLDKKPHVKDVLRDPSLYEWEPKDVPMEQIYEKFVVADRPVSKVLPSMKKEYSAYLRKVKRQDLIDA